MKQFIGRNTQNKPVVKVNFEKFSELYETLVSLNVISISDYNPADKYMFEKYNVDFDEYQDQVDILDPYEYIASKITSIDVSDIQLNEDEYAYIINGCDGVAYYQEIN